MREEEPKLRPHTDTEELPSCTSHSRVTRLFSSAARNQDATLQDGSPKCVLACCICVSWLTHCQAVTGLLVAFRERREIPGTNLSENLKCKPYHCHSLLINVIFHILSKQVFTSSLVWRTASRGSCGESSAPSFCSERRGRRPHFW